MPLQNPKQVNKAAYYVDERNQVCTECFDRLFGVDQTGEIIVPKRLVSCTECEAFAVGTHPSLPKHQPPSGKKSTKPVWLGIMDFQGYPCHVVSETKTGVKKALLAEYMSHDDRDLKNPTFTRLSDALGIWIFEMPFDKIVRP